MNTPLSFVDGAGLIWLSAIILYALLLRLAGASRRRQPASLRIIPLYERIGALLSRAIEAGSSLHLALGSRSVIDATPEIVASTRVAANVIGGLGPESPPAIVSSGDATLFASAAAVGRVSRRDGGAQHVLLSNTALGYAAAVWQMQDQLTTVAPLCFGPFGAEGLLLQEGQQQQGMDRLIGTVEPDAAALMMLGSTAWAVGEDVYAAGAYLGQAGHRRQLAMQDGLRLIILVAVLIGLVVRLCAAWGS